MRAAPTAPAHPAPVFFDDDEVAPPPLAQARALCDSELLPEVEEDVLLALIGTDLPPWAPHGRALRVAQALRRQVGAAAAQLARVRFCGARREAAVVRAVRADDRARVRSLLEGALSPSSAQGAALAERAQLNRLLLESRSPRMARLLIERGAEVNAADDLGTTLLRACQRGDAGLAEALLERGADPDLGGDHQSPLDVAAAEGARALVELLLAGGAQPGESLAHASTPEIADLLMDVGARVGDAISRALANGNIEVARRLFARGVRMPRPELDRALLDAVRARHLRRVELLLDMGARLTSSPGPVGPRLLALLGAHDAVVETTVDQHQTSRLHEAADAGDARALASLIDEGEDPSALDAQGHSALRVAHRANVCGRISDADCRACFSALLSRGASGAGITGELADHGGDPGLYDLLATHGQLRPDEPSFSGGPLFDAVVDARVDHIRALLRHGADARATRPATPFHAADTPLHVAAQRGHLEVIELLLEVGAEIDALCADGRTPLEVARDAEVRAFLRARGARDRS